MKSSSHSSGTMNKYYYISISGIFLFNFILFRCSDEFKLNFVLLIIVSIVSIYLVECSLFLMKPIRKLETHVVLSEEQSFDNRSKYQVLTDLRKNGINAYPHIYPGQFIDSNGLNYNGMKIFPLTSISRKETVFCNETGEYIIFKTDRYGFNNTDNLYDKADIDIVLIGDSFTEGKCVEPNENIAGWLRKQGKRVINLGVSGTSTLIQYAILIEYAKIIKPKIVLWFYFERNDPDELLIEKKSSLLMKYIKDNFSQNLIYKQETIDDALKKYIDDAVKFEEEEEFHIMKRKKENILNSLLKFAKLRHLRLRLGIDKGSIRRKLQLPDNYFRPKKLDNLFNYLLLNADKIVKEWGGQIYFVYLPTAERYYYDVKHDSFMQREHVMSNVEDLGIPIIDIHNPFINHYDTHSLFPHALGHYNSDGYKLVANYILKYLSNENTLINGSR